MGIESLLEYYGKDAKTHPYIEEEPKTPEKKSRKRKRATEKDPVVEEDIEEDIDPNDNSFAQDDANEGRDNHGDNEAMSEYERIRRDNIKELEELKRKVGLGSQSKEWE